MKGKIFDEQNRFEASTWERYFVFSCAHIGRIEFFYSYKCNEHTCERATES